MTGLLECLHGKRICLDKMPARLVDAVVLLKPFQRSAVKMAGGTNISDTCKGVGCGGKWSRTS